jgi:hypothetical protein
MVERLSLIALFACTLVACSDSKPNAAMHDDVLGSDASDDPRDTPCPGPDCATSKSPTVMLLVDSSGSMERTVDCACTTPGCMECLPDCGKHQRNRWISMLEALTGSYDDYSCEALERTEENGATFDVGYFLPRHVPHGTQRADGLLDEYRTKLRFGLATFDSYDTWVGSEPLVSIDRFDQTASHGVDGMWSYSPERDIDSSLRQADGHRIGSFAVAASAAGFQNPPQSGEFLIDTGVRGEDAEQGALMIAGDPADSNMINADIQKSLQRTSAYGSTPIAAALDDLYYFLRYSADGSIDWQNHRSVYVVLLTDGYPDDDYRSAGCDEMHCPYPLAEEAARALRCGQGEDCGPAPVKRLYVVNYANDDSEVTAELDAIAKAGGSDTARPAADGSALKGALQDVFEEILNEP